MVELSQAMWEDAVPYTITQFPPLPYRFSHHGPDLEQVGDGT